MKIRVTKFSEEISDHAISAEVINPGNSIDLVFPYSGQMNDLDESNLRSLISFLNEVLDEVKGVN